MSVPSSIERDPKVRAAVDEALARGATLDEIVAAVAAIGGEQSRSSVHRYAQKYRKLAQRQRDMQAVAATFASDFGAADDKQGRLLVQLGTSLLTRHAMAFEDEEAELGTKELMEFGKAVQSLTSAAKIDADRDAKVREEARRLAKEEAAAAAVGAARSAGASAETIAQVRASILGIAA